MTIISQWIGSWSTRPILVNSPKNQLAQLPTRPKLVNSPKFFKMSLVNSPKTFGQLAQFFTNSPKFKSHLFRVFAKKISIIYTVCISILLFKNNIFNYKLSLLFFLLLLLIMITYYNDCIKKKTILILS